MAVAEVTFEDWRTREQTARMVRAQQRAEEQCTAEAADDAGRYWLERTAVLEHIAEEARVLSRREPDLCAGLSRLLRRLDAVKAPVSRKGDHE